MKKLCFLLAFIALSFNVLAQDSLDKVAVDVRVGLLGNTMIIPQSTFDNLLSKGYSATQSMKIGACAGVTANFNLRGKWCLQTGLLYEWQRFGQTQTSIYEDAEQAHFSIASENSYTIHRLRLPLMAQYHFSTAHNHFLLGFGLFADCALTGDLVYDASAVVNAVDEDGQTVRTNYMADGSLDLFSQNKKYVYYSLSNDSYTNKYEVGNCNIFNRFNVGAVAEIGYLVGNFYIGVQANIGLLNMMNTDFVQTDYVQRNFNLQLQLGYKISNFQ